LAVRAEAGLILSSQGNSQTMVLTSAGNVGIGASTPAYKLQIDASGGNGLSLLGDVDNEASVLFGDSGSAAIGRLTYSNIDDSMRIFTNGTEKVRITSAGNVGIGTSAPRSKFDVATSATEALFIGNTSDTIVADDLLGAVSFGSRDSSTYSSGGITNIRSYATTNYNTGNVSGDIRFYTSNSLQNTTGAALFGTEAMRIASDGNVGIGTSTPATILEVAQVTPVVRLQASASDAFHGIEFRQGVGTDVEMKQLPQSGEFRISSGRAVAWGGFTSFYTDTVERVRITNNGLTFNGDTAAANALDDYEEGTFTPTIIGSTTAGTATYGGGQSGSYTKIGNFVHFTIYLGYSGGTGTGDLRISGLPFTISPSSLPSFTFGVFLAVALSANNFPIAGGIGSTNQIYINQIPTGGGSQTSVPYDDTAVIQVSGSYLV
jgi:hypothetical protein